MTDSEAPHPCVEQNLRDVVEGQILRLADSSFAVLAKHRGHRLVRLDLEADDGSLATLIGVPRARFRLCDQATPR